MEKPRLVILGTGFAAFSLIKDIDEERYDVIVVSPRNHFIFTPLLPSTTVGTIEFRSIIEPIRIAKKGIRYYQASCSRIEADQHLVHCDQESVNGTFMLPYDILVVAVGGKNNTYGIPGVEEHAHFLKELSDARAIRQQIIDCFERANIPGVDENERRRLLHFVVVGGGPTGVEFAAEMHDFLVEDLQKSFPLLIHDVRISIFEATDHILSAFDATLSAFTLKQFRRQRIEVRTGTVVVKVEPQAVHLKNGSIIPYGLLVWSTGVGQRQLVQSLMVEKQSHGRIVVDEYLRVKSFPDIYALGDCATQDGRNLPSTSQVAQQEGRYLAHALTRLAKGTPIKPFEYKHLGMLAYIGSNRALADLSSVKSHGFATWLFWRSTYLTKLVSPKNKLLVIFDWCKTLLFGRDISRF